MKTLMTTLDRAAAWMSAVGGITLVSMMLLTTADVLLRIFGRPITGTYELIALGGAVVVGFAIPQTTIDNANVAVEFFVEGRSRQIQDILFAFSKSLGIILFALLGWFLYEKANDLYKDGFVTSTLKAPFYPVSYGLSFCCFVESLTLLGQIVGRLGREVRDE
jgi:TRAP-type C4-dicarboxylate transport system permease small subunit